MAKFHISADGNPRACRATKNPCKLGGSHAHYATKEEAREAYEVTQQAIKDLHEVTFTGTGVEARETLIQEASRDQDVNSALSGEVKKRLMEELDTLDAKSMLSKTEQDQRREIDFILHEEANNQTFPDYDVEEMSVMTRMKTVLKRKHGWTDEDFDEMTFTDVESEYLDTYGEPDFRPSEKHIQDESVAVGVVEDAERYLKHNLPPTVEEKGKMYRLLSNFDGIGDDHDFMSHKPNKKAALAERLRTVLRHYEEESQIRRTQNSKWI